ncbi:NAD(P)-dependent alcohol dehydrogenase [Kitasatospora sp. NPDC004240]
MKAIVQDVYGPPEVLRLGEVDRPVPGRGEVLLRVRAAAVDAGVWHLMAGLPYAIRLAGFGVRAPKNPVRGLDVAGTVEAVGPEVTGLRPGDEVYGSADGSFAEYARARADRLAPKPAGLDWEQAAAVPVSGCTALQALRDRGRVAAGQRVLVIGAGGGVGTFAVQLAKAFDARVTAVCSGGKAERVRAIGADEVIDHTREDPLAAAGRYDLILDIAGNRPLGRLRRALTVRGTLVIVGGEAGGRMLGGNDRQLRALLLSPFLRRRLTTLAATQRRADLLRLGELIEAGSVRPVIDRVLPLAEVPEAVRLLRAGQVCGKIAIRIGD